MSCTMFFGKLGKRYDFFVLPDDTPKPSAGQHTIVEVDISTGRTQEYPCCVGNCRHTRPSAFFAFAGIFRRM